MEQPTKDCAILGEFWCDYGSKAAPFILGPGHFQTASVEATKRPPLFECRERNEPPASVRYPFDRWLALVGAYNFGGVKLNRREPTAQAEALYMASWAILTPEEIRRRWRGEAGPVIARAWAEGLNGEQQSQIETFYGGRFVAGQWKWGDETIAGRKVSAIPRWVPLDADASGIAAIYLGLWDRWGLRDTDLDLLGAVNPEVGIAAPGTLERLSAADKTKALAQAIVIAAARSKGDAQAFTEASKAIEGQARAWNVPISVEALQGAIASLGAWWQGVRGGVTTAEQAKAAAAGASRVSLAVPLIAIGFLVVLGVIVARRRRH